MNGHVMKFNSRKTIHKLGTFLTVPGVTVVLESRDLSRISRRNTREHIAMYNATDGFNEALVVAKQTTKTDATSIFLPFLRNSNYY